MAKAIMLQGTGSNVGKSILVTALCRILKQDGYSAVPFKSQNMALNSYVTLSGDEMGRAQVAQAEAAGLVPSVKMNPVLLKPTGNSTSQVIIMGKAVGVMSAKQYHTEYSITALQTIEACLRDLHEQYDAMIIEGAGSPAEVNLRATDIANMRIAKLAPAPVILVTDIDRGGALAAVVGTLELLEPDERALVKGIIINKFRGDIVLLKPALDFLEEKTGLPVLGVIPYIDGHGIDDEDSVALDAKQTAHNKAIDIAVIRTGKISNFTDFEVLANETDAGVRYVRYKEDLGKPDLLILPGTKNTVEDLLELRQNGLAHAIIGLAEQGVPIIGICGGYQMLGRKIYDPEHAESSRDELDGLGLLASETIFSSQKLTRQITATCSGKGFLGTIYRGVPLKGYEIHMGRTTIAAGAKAAFAIKQASADKGVDDGLVSDNGLVMGTYIHGIFENDEYRRMIINGLRNRKGLKAQTGGAVISERKEENYNRLAQTVRNALDMDKVYEIMGVRIVTSSK